MCDTCPTHLILLDLSPQQYLARSTGLEAPPYPIFSNRLLLPPTCLFFNIFTASYCQTPSSHDCFLNLDQVSLPYKTIGKIIVMYTAELSYNNLCLCYTSAITLYILWYKKFPIRHMFFRLA